MKAAVYARVSGDKQHEENQLPDLQSYVERNGWELVEYVEKASGKEGGKRPVLAKLLEDARLKKFDVVVVWKMDRFGRSLGDFVNNVRTLDAAGVRFIVPSQSIDTDQRSPFAKFMMHLLAIFAEFERDLIIDRVNAGVQQYRRLYAKGEIGIGKARQSKSGKNHPHGRPEKIWDRDRARDLRARGWSWRAIAKAVKKPQATVRLALKATKK